MNTKKTAHHHGDLRAALIKAGVELIHEQGPYALSIRKVAAKAGVSHAAPAHHFPTLTHLRTAIVAYGHDQFASVMRAEMSVETDKSPRAIMLAAGRGYVKFSSANPALYHLMFGGAKKNINDSLLQQSAQSSYDVLVEITAPLAPGKIGAEGNQLLVWSILHGFAGLILNDHSGKIDKTTAPQLLEKIFPDLPMSQ